MGRGKADVEIGAGKGYRKYYMGTQITYGDNHHIANKITFYFKGS